MVEEAREEHRERPSQLVAPNRYRTGNLCLGECVFCLRPQVFLLELVAN